MGLRLRVTVTLRWEGLSRFGNHLALIRAALEPVVVPDPHEQYPKNPPTSPTACRLAPCIACETSFVNPLEGLSEHAVGVRAKAGN